MDLSRRAFIKAQAAAAAAAAANVTLPASAQNLPAGPDVQLQWSKAPCRFCGTGCGVMVGVKDGKVVATHGDMKAEVNRGLNCVKGYFLSKIMYGADRLTQPLLRMRNGQFAKDGEFQPVSWDRAFDEMARQFKRVLKEKGPDAVGMFGSGQWTIFEGYAASKLMRAGFRTNNLDPNARHCMASAAVTFIRTFGMDEPMGCYDDFEHADAFVLWGSNMAEMHPILWSRVTDRRLSAPARADRDVVDLRAPLDRPVGRADHLQARYRPRDPELHRELHHPDRRGEARLRRQALQHPDGQHRHRLRPAAGARARAAGPARQRRAGLAPIRFRSLREAHGRIHADKVSELAGVPKTTLERLAKLYADPKTKVMSLWTMGFNQHVRGVWANHMVYNLHLLTGKISEPGNSPFSLTGQPSACGTAREVGTFSHRLPADMLVANPEHRKHAEHTWKLPEGLLPGKVGYHAVQQDRMLKDGKLNAYWIMCNNNLQTAPNTNNETYPGYRNPANFVVVSDPYPTVTAMAADLILPTAMWVEKEGAYGNAERRTHFWHQLVEAPGEARSDLWQLIEFSSASPPTRSGRRTSSPRRPNTAARRCSMSFTPMAKPTSSPSPRPTLATRTTRRSISGSTSRRGCSRNMPPSAAGTATTSRPSTPTTRCAACAGPWSTARKPCGAIARATTRTSRRGRGCSSTATPTRRRT